MPLVRVTGVDADAFDISDVAKMNDHTHSRKAWHSRRTNNTPKHLLNLSDATDETPSTDSSSISMVHADRDGGGGSSSMGGRHSFASVNSTHSNMLSNSHGSGNNNRSYNISGSAISNFDNNYDDPRNPFDTQKIPEEDEDGSSSAMEDCSLSGTISSCRGAQHQQQNTGGVRRSNSQRSHSTMSSKRQQQRYQQFSPSSFREEEEDDTMSSASSIQTNSMRNKDNTGCSSSAYTSQLVTQLESQVAKLNFELATTKSSLDQLQLENRKLHDEKSEWHKNTRLIQEENDQLRLKIERMERDKLMRTMEGTKGVARGRPSVGAGSCIVWDGSSVSGNTWADNNDGGYGNTITTHKQELKQVEKLEVPFSDREDFHTYSGRRASTASTGSYRSSADDFLDKSVGSVGSVNLDTSARSQESEEQIIKPRVSILGTLLPMQKLQEMSRNIEERVSSAASNQRRNDDQSTQSNSLNNEESAASAADAAIDDKLGHIEEEYENDDPFATWSEDRERLSSKKKWFQRGDGQKPQSQNIDAEEEELARAYDESIEDPFDTAKGEKKESEYTSFAGDGNHSDDGKGEDFGSIAQQPKRGGFRLPWQRDNEGR